MAALPGLPEVPDGGRRLRAWEEDGTPAEVRLLDKTLTTVAVTRTHRPGRPGRYPDRPIAGRSYDSTPPRESPKSRGIEPIIPARSNIKRVTGQDGRKLRGHALRWIVERTFARIGWRA